MLGGGFVGCWGGPGFWRLVGRVTSMVCPYGFFLRLRGVDTESLAQIEEVVNPLDFRFHFLTLFPMVCWLRSFRTRWQAMFLNSSPVLAHM